jgi:hypothetical protein
MVGKWRQIVGEQKKAKLFKAWLLKSDGTILFQFLQYQFGHFWVDNNRIVFKIKVYAPFLHGIYTNNGFFA